LLSFQHFLLNKGALVELSDVLTRVELEATGLRERNNKTSAQATAHENCHDTEVKDHRGARIVVFDARHTRVFVHLHATWRHHLQIPWRLHFVLRVHHL